MRTGASDAHRCATRRFGAPRRPVGCNVNRAANRSARSRVCASHGRRRPGTGTTTTAGGERFGPPRLISLGDKSVSRETTPHAQESLLRSRQKKRCFPFEAQRNWRLFRTCQQRSMPGQPRQKLRHICVTHRPRHRPVKPLAAAILSPAGEYSHVGKPAARLSQKYRLPLVGFDQRHGTIRTDDRQWQTREPGARSNIRDPQGTRRQPPRQEQRLVVMPLDRLCTIPDAHQVQRPVPAREQLEVRLQ